MAYEPIEPNAQYLLIVYIIMLVLTFILTGKMAAKWIERKTQPTKLMMINFSIYMIAVIVLTIGFIEMVATGEKRELYKLSLGLSYALIVISHIVMIYFMKILFSIENKYTIKYVIIGVVTAILLILPWNYYGVPNDEIGPVNIRPYTSVLLVVYSILVYARFTALCFENARKASDNVAKAGFKYIGTAYIFMILFYVFLFLDVLYFTITDSAGYTFFVYMAWVFAALFFVYIYTGLIMPESVKKRLENK